VTVDALLALAQRIQATGDTALIGSECRDLALSVIDLLGEAQPCGLDEPEVDRGRVRIPEQWDQMNQLPEDARHMARMLLRAADAAERNVDDNTGR
jgi:hypothetical protein